jgi:hypothetical protein
VVSPTPAGAPFFASAPLPAAAGMSALALLYAQAAGGRLVGKQAALDLECFALRRVGGMGNMKLSKPSQGVPGWYQPPEH